MIYNIGFTVPGLITLSYWFCEINTDYSMSPICLNKSWTVDRISNKLGGYLLNHPFGEPASQIYLDILLTLAGYLYENRDSDTLRYIGFVRG